jgi:uncharacterized protein (TIGR02145 family)
MKLPKPLIISTCAVVALAVAVVAVPSVSALVQQLFVSGTPVTDVQVGSTPVNQVYVGSDLVWERAPAVPPVTDLGIMQNFTSTTCDAATDFATATDSRNNQTYYVKKIGNLCWMASNLRWAPPAGTGEGQATQVSGTTASTYNTPQWADPGGSIDYTNYTPASASAFLGYFYNWCAANGSQSTACTAQATVPGTINTAKSVCPAGWRLPTSTEFTTLYSNLGSTYSTVISGFRAVHGGVYSSAVRYQGSNGNYWSSTPYGSSNTSYANYLYFDTSSVTPANYNFRANGFAVRCVR